MASQSTPRSGSEGEWCLFPVAAWSSPAGSLPRQLADAADGPHHCRSECSRPSLTFRPVTSIIFVDEILGAGPTSLAGRGRFRGDLIAEGPHRPRPWRRRRRCDQSSRKSRNPNHAPFLELQRHRSQDLVDQEDLRLTNGHREAQAHVHARGVVLHRLVDELITWRSPIIELG